MALTAHTEIPISTGRDVLISEAHHRVANSLTFVASFARMHTRDIAKRTEPASLEDVRLLLEEIGLQVEAVGQLHRRLAQPNGSASTDLTAYLREISQSVVASLALAGRVHLALTCPLMRRSWLGWQ